VETVSKYAGIGLLSLCLIGLARVMWVQSSTVAPPATAAAIEEPEPYKHSHSRPCPFCNELSELREFNIYGADYNCPNGCAFHADSTGDITVALRGRGASNKTTGAKVGAKE
jgi:hypothetical protein